MLCSWRDSSISARGADDLGIQGEKGSPASLMAWGLDSESPRFALQFAIELPGHRIQRRAIIINDDLRQTRADS
jgi:hypothetical protein